MDLIVLSKRDKVPKGYQAIDVTSSGGPMFKYLSPFYLREDIPLYANAHARNVENAWQYCKVYPCHYSEDGYATHEYYVWAQAGWKNPKAVRYPMGKGAKPLFSLWNGHQYSYVEARKKIYIPIYSREVVKTPAYFALKEIYNNSNVALIDFDGYDHKALGMTYDDVVNNSGRIMGHAFVLAMLLESYIQPGEIYRALS